MNARFPLRKQLLLSLGSAMVCTMLTGCASSASMSASQAALDDADAPATGATSKAVELAEQATANDPGNPSVRAQLGAAYLDAGRFTSAAQAFSEAMTLGDETPKTALQLALSLTAQGEDEAALHVLSDAQDRIAPADLGLAVALAGAPSQGIAILSNGLKQGYNSAKLRQNLGYSYALAGEWGKARAIAAQDVPPEQIGKRMQEWSQSVLPSAPEQRVASLLNLPHGVNDRGMPLMLALNPTERRLADANAGTPTPVQEEAKAPAQMQTEPAPLLAANAELSQPVVAASPYAAPSQPGPGELQPVAETKLAAAPSPNGPAMVSRPVVQSIPAGNTPQQLANLAFADAINSAGNSVGAQRMIKGRTAQDNSHRVQLGSFLSRQHADQAWSKYTAQYAQLNGSEMVLTRARINGREYWRVAAPASDAGEAASLCSAVKANGQDCFAYAADTTLPGTIAESAKLARR
ncbi:tetratricopeptide repeat protein [Altericroceibacterium endophyticum]|uniref:SPOR domain-containing protein n=1 Tax=Altericroceibacterium endophyticum TaxID=1808508 RepID=A0A6I4T6M3_9SPHN|nr:tetratricopeptide repeat protein [Altericroceibacterium endophyticum]MXO66576.1 hypothetical protein [Altericroceibacterium endophyticum]